MTSRAVLGKVAFAAALATAPVGAGAQTVPPVSG